MNTTTDSAALSRRNFIRGAAFGLAGATLLPTLLSSCAPTNLGPSAARPGNAGGVPFPTYRANPLKAVPDLPGDDTGVPDVYYRFPTDNPASVEGEVGSGRTWSVFGQTYQIPPPPLAENPHWQQINEVLNVDWKPNLVISSEFQAKFATLMAGGDIPDIVSLPTAIPVARRSQLIDTAFTDLSPYLSGDAVLDYPNLAAILPYTWNNAYYNGKIMGLPKTDGLETGTFTFHRDILDNLGVSPEFDEYGLTTDIGDMAGFKELALSVTDPSKGRYALAHGWTNGLNGFGLQIIAASFGASNEWKLNSDGSFSSMFDEEEFEAAVAFIADLWKAGVYHPDTPGMNKTQSDSAFREKATVISMEGINGWGHKITDAEFKLGRAIPFAHDGKGEGRHFTRVGAYALTMLRKTENEDEIHEFLRIMNWLCCPFGSEEYLKLYFGVLDDGYELVDGAPVITPVGTEQQKLGTTYLVGPPQVLNYPAGFPGIENQIHYWNKATIPMFVYNDGAFVESDTKSAKAGALQQIMIDAITDIVIGREPISSLAEAVSEWKAAGGAKIAEEYTANYAASLEASK